MFLGIPVDGLHNQLMVSDVFASLEQDVCFEFLDKELFLRKKVNSGRLRGYSLCLSFYGRFPPPSFFLRGLFFRGYPTRLVVLVGRGARIRGVIILTIQVVTKVFDRS